MGCVTRGSGLTVSSSLHSAQNQLRFGATVWVGNRGVPALATWLPFLLMEELFHLGSRSKGGFRV